MSFTVHTLGCCVFTPDEVAKLEVDVWRLRAVGREGEMGLAIATTCVSGFLAAARYIAADTGNT